MSINKSFLSVIQCRNYAVGHLHLVILTFQFDPKWLHLQENQPEHDYCWLSPSRRPQKEQAEILAIFPILLIIRINRLASANQRHLKLLFVLFSTLNHLTWVLSRHIFFLLSSWINMNTAPRLHLCKSLHCNLWAFTSVISFTISYWFMTYIFYLNILKAIKFLRKPNSVWICFYF